MTTPVVASSELEAVNFMLDTIGEAPVSSIEGSGLVDVKIAVNTLAMVSRQVQVEGWAFNTDFNYLLAKDASGNIPISPSLMRFRLSKQSPNNFSVAPVIRGLKLYDRQNHTLIFTSDVYGDIVWLLPFSDIPQAARNYIMVKAARLFQDKVLGNDALHAYTANDEAVARSGMIEDDTDSTSANMLTDSWSSYQILAR